MDTCSATVFDETANQRASRCVLIVDPSEDSREVLKTALQRRGIRTLHAEGAAEGLELARRQHPGLIILDAESLPPEGPAWQADFETEAGHSGASLVLLGRARRTSNGGTDDRYVAKPYHFAPLVRKIEGLLGT